MGVGALGMLAATRRFNLSLQPWFAAGEQGERLEVPARMLWGCNITTEIGYEYKGSSLNSTVDPLVLKSAITAPDGDGGDNVFMNQAANLWLPNTWCLQARLPNINHFQLVNDSSVLHMA